MQPSELEEWKVETQKHTLVQLTVCLALVLGFTGLWGAGAALATAACDPDFVVQDGSRFTVLPTGTNDTANLQCAFDAALAAGPGSEVRLLAGEYHTAQIVVNDFDGSFTGAGADRTTLFNLPDLPVASEYWANPPSHENPYPILFFFVDGDLAIHRLAIRIVGDQPTKRWWLYDFGPFDELATAIAISGVEAHAEVSYISVQARAKPASIFGYTLGNGVYYNGWTPWMGSPPLSGSYNIHHSTFRSVGYASPVGNAQNASLVSQRNSYADVFIAMDSGDMVDSNFEFSHNKVQDAAIGVQFWDSGPREHVGGTILVANNMFRTEYVGVDFEQTSTEGTQCLVLGNNLQQAAGAGIYLGPATKGCTVVGGGGNTNVVDEGTDNVLVGVNNMGAGVGPAIHAVRRLH